MHKLALLLVCLLLAGCGASREVRDYLEKLGPPKNHLAEIEKLRQPIFQRAITALKERRSGDPYVEVLGLRTQVLAARAEWSKQMTYLMAQPPPADCRGFYLAYYQYLQREDSYFKSTEVIFALLDTIPRGGAAPGLRELTLDDQSLTKSATQAGEDFKAIEATYQRTR